MDFTAVFKGLSPEKQENVFQEKAPKSCKEVIIPEYVVNVK